MSFLIRRLLLTIPVVVGVTTITFFLLHFVPGDPVDIMLGDQATTIDKEALRRDLGLDQPLHLQYFRFYQNLFSLDLGISLFSKKPVSAEIAERLPATIELSLVAMILALLIGIPFGILASIRKNDWLDRSLHFLSLFGLSVPGFWIAPLLILVFSIHLDLLPVSERSGWLSVILPAISLAFGLSTALMQITRASMLEVLKEQYVQVARAKGLDSFRLYFKHTLANALIPILTVIGLQFGALLTGTVIIETIFDWPGIGSLLYQAIQQRNYPLVQGCVLVIALTYVFVNLLTDLSYAVANPRVRLK